MDLEKAKQEFIKYTSNYDMENEHIKRKIGHSIRVMEISTKIAESLDLSKEEIELATLIGLLHDIARFEQWRRFETYNDILSIDHGNLGVEILKENNFIRNFIGDDKFDQLIYIAIKNHNKFKIEDGLTEKELLFSKIIRDADKLDIIYEGVEIFWGNEQEIKETEESSITEEVYNKFIAKKLIDRTYILTKADKIISFIAFIFDINFKFDFKVIKQEDYINKILDRFNFKEKEKMENVRKIANEYIKTKNEG